MYTYTDTYIYKYVYIYIYIYLYIYIYINIYACNNLSQTCKNCRTPIATYRTPNNNL